MALNPPPIRQRGSMLLEGLIAILIFSIGILALMAMLGTSVKNSGDAKYRADASHLADQIIGSMWADRANLAAYAHYPVAGASVCSPAGAASAAASVPNSNIANWLRDVGGIDPITGILVGFLPGAPAASQQIVVGANNVVTVTICWQGPQETSPHNFVATAQLNFNP